MHDKLIQLDGNDTFSESEFLFDSSSDSSVMSSLGSDDDSIPVIVNIFQNNQHFSPAPPWYEPPQKPYKYRKPVRVTLRRDNRLEQSDYLPIIAVSNLRSLIPKIGNFVQDMKERDIGVNLLSEIWEKPRKRKHRFKIDQMLHMEGLKYISTPRPPARRGGGAAIVAPTSKFNLEKIDISIPHNLEICWGMLRPKSEQLMQVKEIIVASFYSPPKSRKKSKLLDHILTTLHVLLTKYPRAGIIIGADRNDLNISSLLVGLPRVRQIVTEYTYQRKIHFLYLYLYKSARLTMGLRGYDYYLDQPTRYHHTRLHANVPPSNSS